MDDKLYVIFDDGQRDGVGVQHHVLTGKQCDEHAGTAEWMAWNEGQHCLCVSLCPNPTAQTTNWKAVVEELQALLPAMLAHSREPPSSLYTLQDVATSLEYLVKKHTTGG